MACMEDVLELYAEPYDPKCPVVCFDETSKQLVAEKSFPIPAKAGRRERFDYEYKRNGTRNLFMLCEPLAGWRHLEVTERHTMKDFAHQMRWLVLLKPPIHPDNGANSDANPVMMEVPSAGLIDEVVDLWRCINPNPPKEGVGLAS